MRKELIVVLGGLIFIALGVVLNVKVVAYILTYDGVLDGPSKAAVWIFDILMVAGGLLAIKFRATLSNKFSFSRTALIHAVIYILLIVIGLEISARIIDGLQNHKFTAEKEITADILPFRIFGEEYYTEKDGNLFIKSLHGEIYPLEKGEGTVRVVAFGGSTTQQRTEDGLHYPLILEQKLSEKYPEKNIEVINVSNSGYATPHSLIIFMLDALSWDPDIVMMNHNMNDLTAAYFPDFRYDYSNKYSNDFFVSELVRENRTLDWLYEWSTLYWILEQQLRAYAYKQKVGEDFYIRKSYGSEPPEMARSAFRRNLKTFVDIAQARGIKAVLSTQPFTPSFEYFDRGKRFKPYNDVVVYPLHEEYVAHHAYYNDIIRDVARSEGAYLIDNAADIGANEELFIDNVHSTSDGLQKLGENFAQFFLRNGFVR